MLHNAILIGIIALASAPQTAPTARTQSIHSVGIERKYEFAIVSADGSTHSWGSWNTSDIKKMGGTGDRIIVKKKDGTQYVITDKRTYEAASKAIEPVMELGRQQGQLGRQQGELGRKQGELGRQQGEYGQEMGRLAREMSQLAHSDDSGRTKERRDELRRQMEANGESMKALGEKQKSLGEQQKALGERQGELGKKQGEAAKKADGAITRLLDEAFTKGLAKPI